MEGDMSKVLAAVKWGDESYALYEHNGNEGCDICDLYTSRGGPCKVDRDCVFYDVCWHIRELHDGQHNDNMYYWRRV